MQKTEITNHAQEVRNAGYTLLRDHLRSSVVEDLAVAFEPIYAKHLDEIRDNPNRGAMRHYIELPFAEPFYRSQVHADADIVAIVRSLLGDDARLIQYATDTPAMGSEHQDWHGDLQPVFPEYPESWHPPIVLAVNFPFVDVTDENGPVEIADGTHLLPFDDALQKIQDGKLQAKRVLMNLGDVLIRDPRCVHRGTPNTTNTPRPMAVFAFERSWSHSHSSHHAGSMSRALYDTLSEMEQKLLERIVAPA
jgi:ectoine hydroxylase-related dioxygenase (phytanoyl-CoA dioxygenase family)